MTIYIYKMLYDMFGDFEKLSEQITEHEEKGWTLVQFFGGVQDTVAYVRKPKN